MGTTVEAYSFRDDIAPGSASNLCLVPEEQLRPLLTLDDLSEIFFGYAIYRNEADEAFIGVWGLRNAAKLRSLLRARGAEVVLRKEAPDARISVLARNYERKLR